MPYRPAVGALLFAATLLPPASPAAAASCAPALAVLDARAGTVLARVPLDRDDPRFATAYRHSVTGATVTDEYRADGHRIVLVRERFSGAGYGLAHGPGGAGERFDIQPDGSVLLSLERPIDRLVVRVAETARNRVTAPEPLDLTRWGDGPRELAIQPCPSEGF